MNKLIIPIIAVVIFTIGIGAFVVLQRPTPPEQQNRLCGDGVCDVNENNNPNLCPQDCEKQETAPPNTITPIITPFKQPTSSSEDSPFGIFAAFAQEFPYFKKRMDFTNDDYWEWTEDHIKNLGAHWTRSNVQLIWDFIELEIGMGYKWDNSRMLTDRTIERMYLPGNNVH